MVVESKFEEDLAPHVRDYTCLSRFMILDVRGNFKTNSIQVEECDIGQDIGQF